MCKFFVVVRLSPPILLIYYSVKFFYIIYITADAWDHINNSFLFKTYLNIGFMVEIWSFFPYGKCTHRYTTVLTIFLPQKALIIILKIYGIKNWIKYYRIPYIDIPTEHTATRGFLYSQSNFDEPPSFRFYITYIHSYFFIKPDSFCCSTILLPKAD